MRGFSTYATEVVTLRRGAEVVELRVRPLPFGWYAMLDEILPAPTPPINQAAPSPALVAKHRSRQNMLILAKGLEAGTFDAQEPPPGASPAAWELYADAIRAELQSANLVEGDLQTVLDVLGRLNKGIDGLPKA